MNRFIVLFTASVIGACAVSCNDEKADGIPDNLREHGDMVLQACSDAVDSAAVDMTMIQTLIGVATQTAAVPLKSILKLEKNSGAVMSFLQGILPYTDPESGICMLSPCNVKAHFKLVGDSIAIEPGSSPEFSVINGQSVLHAVLTCSEDILIPIPLPVNTAGLASPGGTPVSAMVLAVPSRAHLEVSLNGSSLAEAGYSALFDYRKLADGFNSAEDPLSVTVTANAGHNNLDMSIECKADDMLSLVLDWSRFGNLISRISVTGTDFAITDDLKFESLEQLRLEAGLAGSVRIAATIASVNSIVSLIMQFFGNGIGSSTAGSGKSIIEKDRKGLMYLISVAMNEYLDTDIFISGNTEPSGKLNYERRISSLSGIWTIGPQYMTGGHVFTHNDYEGLFSQDRYDAFVHKLITFIGSFQK